MKDYIIAIVIFVIIVALIIAAPVFMDRIESAKADELLDDCLVNGKYIVQGLYPSKWFPDEYICLRYDGSKYAVVEITDEFGKTWGHWQWKVNPGEKVMVYIPNGMYLNISFGALTIIDDMSWIEEDNE